MIYQIVKKAKVEEVDRISSLPDGVIHHILSFFDVKFAVRTSVLSKRWKFIWKTLPFLNFEGYDYRHGKRRKKAAYSEYIDRVLRLRNHESSVLILNLFVPMITSLTENLREYAISHNVEDLTLVLRMHGHPYYKLSTFSSNSIRKLKLGVCIDQSDQLSESGCWNLPALTTLHLMYPEFKKDYKLLSIAFITCLPSLTTLCLDGKGCDFLESSICFRLPALTTLHLARCKLPNRVWDLPALLSLELEDVIFPDNINDFFPALVSLQNLTLCFNIVSVNQDISISCPLLINFQIKTSINTSSNFSGKIVVSTPALCNFSSVGIYPITFLVSKLENVSIRLRGLTDEVTIRRGRLNQYFQQSTSMFSGLGSANILSLDLETIQALSAVSDFLKQSPSPFYNLDYVKLPQEYRESSISSTLRSYLLGGSPRAKIVTTLPQVRTQMQEEPLSTPSKELVNIHKRVCADTLEMEVPLVGNSVVDASTMAGIYGQCDSVVQGFSGPGPDAPVTRAENNQTSSFGGDSDFGLWQGQEVNWEFISLLDLIAKKYPETFENFTAKSKKLCTMKLNMLCTSVNDFTNTSVAEVNTETITEYRALFAALQNLGFTINWLVSHLDYIEQLCFSNPLLNELYSIDSRIHDLQTLRAEKMAQIEKAFGTIGTNLVGNIGDGILKLSAP